MLVIANIFCQTLDHLFTQRSPVHGNLTCFSFHLLWGFKNTLYYLTSSFPVYYPWVVYCILLEIMFSHFLQVPAEPAVQPQADDTYADIEDSESEEGIMT